MVFKSIAKGKFKTLKKNVKKDWQLLLMIIFPALGWLIFDYFPMFGIQLAFRDYRPNGGIWGSEWVGLKWFKYFLSSPQFLQVFKNTFILSAYNLLVSFPLPIILALLLNSMHNKTYGKVIKIVSYVPHFISMAVFVGIVNLLLSPICGIYGSFYHLLGGEGYPENFRATAEAFRHIYVWSGVWQGIGWASILYTSTLSSVDPGLHEAAIIDGATRIQRIIHIDWPAILPTVGIMFIQRIGGLVGVGFEKAYLLQTPMNLTYSEVISTYVFKRGLSSFRNYSFGAAVGLFNNILSVSLMLLANYISKKASDDEISLF